MMVTRIFLPATLMLASCTNFAAVESASGKLVDAGRSWDRIAGEIEASCRRYDQISAIPQDCAPAAQATRGMIAANAVLVAYFAALRDSAASGAFSLRAPLEGVANEAAAIPGASADKVQAMGALAQLLTDLASRGLREEAVKQLVDQGAGPARNVVQLLKDTVPAALEERLKVEQAQRTSAYADLIEPRAAGLIGGAAGGTPCATPPRLRDAGPGPGGGQALLLAADYCTQHAALAARLAAIAEYRQSLDLADRTLAALQAGKMRLGAKETIRELVTLKAQLEDSVEGVRKAFSAEMTA